MLPVELTRTSRAHNRQLRSTVCESPAETLERGGVLHSDPRSFLAAVWSPPVPRLLAVVLFVLAAVLAIAGVALGIAGFTGKVQASTYPFLLIGTSLLWGYVR